MAGASPIVSETFGKVAHPPPRIRMESRTKSSGKDLTLIMVISLRKNLLRFCSPTKSRICAGSVSAGLLHGTLIKDLTLAALNESLCLSVEIEEWPGEGLDRAHRAYTGAPMGRSLPRCVPLEELGVLSQSRLRHCLVSLSCSRSHFFRDNSFADRGQRNASQLQVLYPKRNADNRDEVKQSRRHMPERQPDAGKDEPYHVPDGPQGPSANIIFLRKFPSADCFLAEWKECELAYNEACLTQGMPTTDTYANSPAIHQASPIHTPPRINQSRLPIARIIFSFFSVLRTAH